MSVGGLALLLAIALVPFLVGAAIGGFLARVPWGLLAAVIVGAAIALPLFVSAYRLYTPDDYDSFGPSGHGIAFFVLSVFVVWVLGVGVGAGIGRLASPVPKR